MKALLITIAASVGCWAAAQAEDIKPALTSAPSPIVKNAPAKFITLGKRVLPAPPRKAGCYVCEFRRNPAGDSDLKPATVPI
jgi:hypothetical protein